VNSAGSAIWGTKPQLRPLNSYHVPTVCNFVNQKEVALARPTLLSKRALRIGHPVIIHEEIEWVSICWWMRFNLLLAQWTLEASTCIDFSYERVTAIMLGLLRYARFGVRNSDFDCELLQRLFLLQGPPLFYWRRSQAICLASVSWSAVQHCYYRRRSF
jgi:hypothetical protein